jgi:glycosyltransferase involved in cell wall biosynthesis
MLILVILLLASFGYYLWFLLSVRRGLKRQEGSQRADGSGFVTVVVAARNEERTIKRCLQSLLDQTYPEESYEIIVVDDHSTDRTARVVAETAATLRRGRLIHVSLGDVSASGGKPRAIAEGIRHARGDVILCTDADCVTPRGWIRSMAGQFGPGVAFVAGPVLESPSE